MVRNQIIKLKTKTSIAIIECTLPDGRHPLYQKNIWKIDQNLYKYHVINKGRIYKQLDTISSFEE